MINSILNICRTYPQIVIFLAIAIGYFVGKIKIRGFNLGSTASILIAGLVLGQMNIEIPPLLQNVFFALFIFCIGYKVGPEFFGSLKKDGAKYISISLIIAFLALALAIILGKYFGFDKGTTAGFFAGSMTQSAAIGTAQGAIEHLSVSAAEKATLSSNVAVAYAVTYIFGTIGLVLFFKVIPRLWHMSLKDEAKKLEAEMTGGADLSKSPELFSWSNQLNLRAYRITNKKVLGKTVKEIEAMFPERIAIDKVKHEGNVMDSTADTVLQLNDIVAIVGPRPKLFRANEIVGPEIDDKEVVDLVGEVLDICVLNKQMAGKTLGELGKLGVGHGCFLRKITRQEHELPITRDTVVKKCDILQITGEQKDVERAVKHLGYPERPTAATDLIMVGIGCVIGTLIGLLSVTIGGIPITLGTGGGILIAGLLFGWLRSVHPTFGQIPSGAQWIFSDLGLNLYVACVGLSAGAKAITALQTTGASIFFAGVILTLVPVIVGLLFGRYILKMNPILLFGALTGARSCNAAFNSLKEDADSSMPALGFTIPYAFANVFLTIWGTVIVNVM